MRSKKEDKMKIALLLGVDNLRWNIFIEQFSKPGLGGQKVKEDPRQK